MKLKSDKSTAVVSQDVTQFQKLQKLLQLANTDDDEFLDYDELHLGPVGEIFEELGLSTATQALKEFDKNGDGVLDRTELTSILARLVPNMQQDIDKMKGRREYEEAINAQENLDTIKQSITNDFLQQQTNALNGERNQLLNLKSYEQLQFKQDWDELASLIKYWFDIKIEGCKRIFQYREKMLMKQEGNLIHPTGPKTPKINSDGLNLRARMEIMATTNRLKEANKLRYLVEKQEQLAAYKWKNFQQQYMDRKKRQLKIEEQKHIEKLENTRSSVLGKLRAYKAKELKRLRNRHDIFQARMEHGRTMATKKKVLRGWPQRLAQMPQVPPCEQDYPQQRPQTTTATTFFGRTSIGDDFLPEFLPQVNTFRPGTGISDLQAAKRAKMAHSLVGLFEQQPNIVPTNVQSKLKSYLRPQTVQN